MGDATAIFSIHDQKDIEIHEFVQQVYDALKEKGYNPVNQLVGYILDVYKRQTQLPHNNNRKEEKGMSMIVSTKGRYALRVMIDLAEHRSEKYVPRCV